MGGISEMREGTGEPPPKVTAASRRLAATEDSGNDLVSSASLLLAQLPCPFPLSEKLSAASVRISPHARANSLLLFIAT